MSGASIEVHGIEELNAGIAKLSGLIGAEPTFDFLGAVVESQVKRRLATEKTDFETGEAWAELSPWYAEQKKAGTKYKKASSGGVLDYTGALQDSITYEASDDSVIVGTNVVYGAAMHFGGKQGSFGNGSPWGDIPERKYMGMSKDNVTEAMEELNDHIDRVMQA